IEPADRRVQTGRAPAGTITLDLSLDEGKLWFRLKDDGKGLALGHIRKKATESGLIHDGDQLSPQDLAQLIFAPGFSTASTVTEVSGRGVGMDAVKAFVEREGGTIELRLHDTASADGYHPFETLIALPAKFGYQLTA
ncbi:MAG: ATP-binding protein, partial [Burkholderiaceae bacterium]